MKAYRTIRCLVPIAMGVSFLAFAFTRIRSSGPHLLPCGVGIIGLVALASGLYYGIWGIEYCAHGFVVHPGKRRYTLQDVTSWKAGEVTGGEPGHRRHLELRFGPWYRRYMLFEEDISSETFNALLKSLRER